MLKRLMKNKKGIVSEALPWIIIAIAVLVILTIGIYAMKGEGVSLIDKVKGLFKFR